MVQGKLRVSKKLRRALYNKIIVDPKVMVGIPPVYITQDLCNVVVRSMPWHIKYVPDQYITQVMCNKVVNEVAWALEFIPDRYKDSRYVQLCS